MAVQESAHPLSVAARPELTGNRSIGVLLSHGFTGSPLSMRPWGEHLAALGYAVEVPRLPGHGTTWQEMNTTTFDDWYGEIASAFRRLSDTCDAVVVCGLSLGGSLVLRIAAENPDLVSGVVLVNPGIILKDPRMVILPVLKHALPSLPGIGADIKKPGGTEGAYDRTPLKALHSMLNGWAALRPQLSKVTAPILYFHSTEDHVVDDRSQAVIRSSVSGEVTYVRLHDSYHVATVDNDAPQIFEESAAFIARVTA